MKVKAAIRKLRELLKAKGLSDQKGFTLLELLIVVAILAAIAGTASIALKDTDARASAAAHVAMMDELNKGIHTYRVLNRNVLPSRFDSLMQMSATGLTGATTATALDILGFSEEDGYAVGSLPTDVQAIMYAGGLEELRYVNTALTGDGFVCTDIETLVKSRANDVVPGNIFLSPSANGCGESVDLWDGVSTEPTELPNALYWTGGNERLTGQPNPGGDTNYYDNGNYVYLMTGIGPSCTLFDANQIGGMTTVPSYRHVKPLEYNRFIAVWNVGTYTGTATGITAGDQLDLTAIIDGALDTKEEELGEWDGTRNTI